MVNKQTRDAIIIDVFIIKKEKKKRKRKRKGKEKRKALVFIRRQHAVLNDRFT